ncbi:MAG TPA: rod shape-determining protein MreC [Gemmatimonadales bacterium]|jgi:rod shape-determining protein MreC|nr:rod shape-determining protein MreC [Gemmatimonadales bacterium]
MREPTGRSEARGDLLLFAGCIALSLVALALPHNWATGVAGFFRSTIFRPLIALDTRAVQDRTARFRLGALEHRADSLALLVEGTTALRRENDNLRALDSLEARLVPAHVAAEVLHRPTSTDGRMLLLSAGRDRGVAPFDPVITADGLIGQIWSVDAHSSSALTWTDPDFRAAAVTADGRVRGILAPSPAVDVNRAVLELHGVALRDSLKMGTVVYTSGDGSAYPRGIVVGRITAVHNDDQGYERVYRVIPFANPGDVTHVLILTGAHDSTAAHGAPPR